MGRAKPAMTIFPRRYAAAFVALLAIALLASCGRASGDEIVTGPLRAGDTGYWLVGTTLVAIGGAQIEGEKSQLGSTVRAEGRRQTDGTFAATHITVSAADPSAPAASLPTATASGAVESQDPATGRWQIAGRQVQVAPGLAPTAPVAVGDRVTVKGYTLPDGVLLAAEITTDRPTPTATPTQPAATPTATPPAPAAPDSSIAPAPPPPTEEPKKTKPPRNGPGNRGNDDDDD